MAIKNIYDTEISAVSFTWNGNTIATQAWVNANVSTPTLDAVTTAGGTTSNDITVGNITASSSLLGGSYTQPAGSSWTTSNSQLILGGAHNAGFNTGTKAKLLISGYDNDGSTIYPIFVEDENGYADFWVKNRSSAAGESTAFFSGKVGIGTTSPSRKLHIVDSVWDNSNGGGVIFENSNTVGASLTLKPSASVVTNGANGWALYAGGPGAAIGDGNLGFWAHATNDARMVIQRGGNVGIGTTGPGEKLHVLSSGNTVARFETSSTSDMAIELKNSQGSMFFGLGGGEEFAVGTDADLNGANSKFVVKSSGNVGIGTTSPATALDVNGSIRVTGRTTPTSGNGLELFYYSPNDLFYLEAYNYTTSAYKAIRYAALSHQFITGNVGIGTTSPVYKLDVTGDIRTSGAFRGVNIALSGYIDLTGHLNHRSNIRVLNKLGTNWITWATRDTSGTDSKVVLSNVKGDISQFTNDSGYLTSVPSHQHTDADINSWHNRQTVNIDTYNPDSNWSTSIATSTSHGTQPSNYTNIHNLGGDGVDFQTQIATYYGNNNRMWVRSRYDGTNAWVGWNEVWTSGSFANNSANWDTAYSWGDHASAGYLTSYSETDTLATVVARGAFFGTTNQGYVASGGTYGTELRKIKRITLTRGSSNWDSDNHAILSEDISGADADSISINSYNGIHLRLDSNNNDVNSNTNFTIHNNTTTNTNELFRVTGDGNVGIGTTSPDRNLHVYQGNSGVTGYALTGGIDIESTSISGINILSPNAGYGRIYFGAPISKTAGAIEYIHNATLASGYMKLRAGGADRVFILGNGNVGIGTTGPGTKLDVKNGGETIRITGSTTGNAFTGWMSFVDSAGTRHGYIGYGSSGDDNLIINSDGGSLRLRAGNNDTAYVTSTGVGIGTSSPGYTLDVNGSMHSTNITIADAIYHEGDTNTVIGFGTDTINLSTGGGVRATINNSGTKFNNDVVVVGGATLSLGERGEPDDLGRTVLLEGAANAGSGEGAGRIFFSEHNSTTAGADSYGLSLYYEGDPNIALPSGFQPNTGNGTWSLRRHNNSVNGAAIMSGSRTNSDVQFGGSITIGSGVTLSESTDRADLLMIKSSTSVWGGLQVSNTSNEIIFSLMGDGATGGIYDDQNSDWLIQWTENAGVRLYYNASQKLATTSTGVSITGDLVASGDITAFSDARVKENVETLPNALESVKAMRGVTYNKIGEEKESIGVIAQEVQAVLPQLVSEHKDEMLSVAYGNITAVLIEAVKELTAKVESLEEQLKNK